MEKIIKAAVDRGASDLHIKAGDVFRARIHGELVPLTKQALTPEQTRSIALHLMQNEDDKARIDKILDYDCSWSASRGRAIPRQHHAAARIVLDHHARHPVGGADVREARPAAGAGARSPSVERGMVLVTGVTGSGKSSTMAALDQLHQPAREPPHPHARESDRVPAPRQEDRRSRSARSARTRRTSRWDCAPRSVRIRTSS